MRKTVLRFIKDNKFVAYFLAHKKITIPVLVVLLVLFIIFRPKAPPNIETERVSKGTITQAVTASGAVASDQSVNLNFVTSGKVTYIGAKKGDRVRAGQVLATLDTRSTQKSLEASLRDYDKQRNSFEQLKKDKGVTSINDAQDEAVKRILENNQYDLEKAVISVELQNLAKESSVLTSPIDGVLIRADATVPGINVSPTSVFTVADTDNLVFQVDVDEADIGKIHLGQVMKISFDAYPDEIVSATIRSIDFASHSTSTGGTAYTVEAELPISAQDRYRIGMNGDAEIVTSEKRNVLTIPISSLVDDTHVYVKKEKTYEKRSIRTGIQSDLEIEVKSGLSEGESVAALPDDVEKHFPKLTAKTK